MTTKPQQPKEQTEVKTIPWKRPDFGGTLTLSGIKKPKKK